HIFRDSHDPDNFDRYTFTVTGTLNTANDDILLDADGNLLDDTCIQGYSIFNTEGSPTSWRELTIQSYDHRKREFGYSGRIRTSDYITERDTLQIIEGLFTKGSMDPYNSVIDFTDSQFQLYFSYKYDNSAGYYTRSDEFYSLIPSSETNG